ncbi:Hypothetical predicted protein [Paramuricea clavata]|uniref:Reverse transcriptase domain-containing protein n=1 Tax=Paramuricea clavata TaxID=317549 RepID=A0A7D9E296_PARCT|nr:Hypothetical predicted protein [Paramuricea clavata]
MAPIAVTIDSGAATNILDSEAFACIRKINKHVQLEPTQTNIYAYNAVQPLPLLGKCRLAVESNGKRTISTFYVVNGKAGSLLGNETAAELGILKIKVNEVSKFHSMKTTGSRGATTNILDSEAFACIRKRNKHVQLEPTQTNIYAYNAVQPLPLLGKCRLAVESNGKRTISTFYVVNGKAGSLLGNETAAELGILKIKVNEVSKFHSMKTTGSRGRNEINTGSHSNGSDANSQSDSGNREIRDRNSMKNIDINTQKILDKFPELSDGIGCLQNYEQSLHVDRTVSPIAQRPRRVPFHLRKQVSDKLEELQIAAPKPHNSDEIRLCGDYRRPNQALLRERHPIPTVDELMEEMSGAVVFSKLDLKAGYHQIVLEENSRNITTFCTHKGLFRYKRLPFGLSCASEVFQNAKRSKVYTGYEISQTILLYGVKPKPSMTRI